MPNSIKSFSISSVLVCLLAIIGGGCNFVERAPTQFTQKFVGRSIQSVQSRPGAGQWSISDQSLSNALDKFITDLKINRADIVTAKLDSLVFTIPNTSKVDFGSYFSTFLVLRNLTPTGATKLDSIAIVFPDLQGTKVNKLVSDCRVSQTGPNRFCAFDVTRALRSPNLSCIAYYRTIQATPATEIIMDYSFELSYIRAQ